MKVKIFLRIIRDVSLWPGKINRDILCPEPSLAAYCDSCLKPVKAGLFVPLYEMALAAGRSVVAGDGSVVSTADPSRTGASAVALPQ